MFLSRKQSVSVVGRTSTFNRQAARSAENRSNLMCNLWKKCTLGSVLAVASVLLGGNQAWAHRSPATCNANNLNVNISKNANNVTNGTVVQFVATIENPVGLVGGNQGCDITLGPQGLLFICPGGNGLPTGQTNLLIPGGTVLPGFGTGFGPISFTNSCLINITNGTT